MMAALRGTFLVPWDLIRIEKRRMERTLGWLFHPLFLIAFARPHVVSQHSQSVPHAKSHNALALCPENLNGMMT